MPALADHGKFSTCWKCGSGGENGGGDYKICDWGGMLKDPDAVVCCKPGATSTYCKANDMNYCSKSKNEEPNAWYTYCGGVNSYENSKKCGGY